jgi:hypothetical protein
MCTTREPLEDATALLLALIRRGFRFTHPHDASGDLLAIQGVRVHHDVIDVVVLRSEDEARAVRMPGDEHDILRPGTVLWEKAGPARAVLAELLELPDSGAAMKVTTEGCWVPMDAGHAVWLRATTA